MIPKTIEYWRSRFFPRDRVYWRYVNHHGHRYPPDDGTPSELAALLRQACQLYGQPRRAIRNGIGGPIVSLTFSNVNRAFSFRVGAGKWTKKSIN